MRQQGDQVLDSGCIEGATRTGEVTGGAPADAAVGGASTGVAVSKANKSGGCAYGGTRSGDGRIPGLLVLLVTAVALLLKENFGKKLREASGTTPRPMGVTAIRRRRLPSTRV